MYRDQGTVYTVQFNIVIHGSYILFTCCLGINVQYNFALSVLSTVYYNQSILRGQFML